MPHVGGVNYPQYAVFARAHEQGGSRQEHGPAGAQVQIERIQRRLVVGGKVVDYRESKRGAHLHDTVPVVRARTVIKGAVPGHEVDIVRISQQALSASPYAAIGTVGSGVENGYLLQAGRAIAKKPTVPRRRFTVATEGHVHEAVKQQETRTIVLLQSIETD